MPKKSAVITCVGTVSEWTRVAQQLRALALYWLLPGFESQLCHFLAMWLEPQSSHLYICKMGWWAVPKSRTLWGLDELLSVKYPSGSYKHWLFLIWDVPVFCSLWMQSLRHPMCLSRCTWVTVNVSVTLLSVEANLCHSVSCHSVAESWCGCHCAQLMEWDCHWTSVPTSKSYVEILISSSSEWEMQPFLEIRSL